MNGACHMKVRFLPGSAGVCTQRSGFVADEMAEIRRSSGVAGPSMNLWDRGPLCPLLAWSQRATAGEEERAGEVARCPREELVLLVVLALVVVGDDLGDRHGDLLSGRDVEEFVGAV